MLSTILGNTKTANKQITDLFSKSINIIQMEDSQNEEQVEEEQNDIQQQQESNQIDQELEDRKRRSRTLFVGNLDINATKNDITKLFRQYGNIQKVWFRAIPVDRTTKNEKSKLPIRAAVIMKKYQEGASTKICYVLFDTPQAAKQATQQDGQIFMDRHLRCTLEGVKKMDHIRTAFIGNLPFNIDDEVVRDAFSQFGEVSYVRIIRDSHTHQGKGFGYVSFKEFGSLKKALSQGTIEINEREVRIKKAAAQTKSSNSNNPKNAFRRIQKKSPKIAPSVQIRKKVKKMKKKNYNKKEIAKQVENIKAKKVVKDSNIFNQQY